jgi:AraC-like DNA-binding protein
MTPPAENGPDGAYHERPSVLLPRAIVWTRTTADGEARILPDGCMDLIWSASGGLLAAGPDTHAHLTEDPAGIRYVGLRFAPGTGPAVLGVPAHELRDQRVPLDTLWPGARRLAESLAEAADPAAALEALAVRRLADAGPPPLPRAVTEGLAAGRTVAAVAGAAGLSERQLRRRALDAYGYGPKTLARVLRLRHALALAVRGMPFAAVAATAGYADQAHLSREVRDLTGVPLGELLR